MRIKWDSRLKRPLAVGAICFILAGQHVLAQNLGASPQFKVAVQGQTGAQPEGAFLNFINWVGNVIAPVSAGRRGDGGYRRLADGMSTKGSEES